VGVIGQYDGYSINEVVIQNTSHDHIKNVKIQVKPTKELFFCGLVLSGSECSNKLPLRRYQGNPIVVSWLVDGKQAMTKEFVVDVPSTAVKETALIAVITFEDKGVLKAHFEQR